MPHGGTPSTLDHEIRTTTTLFHGWLQVRDPDRLRLHETQERIGDLSERLQYAEEQAAGLLSELADARREHAQRVRELAARSAELSEAWEQGKEEIRWLTREIHEYARHIDRLERALRDAWGSCSSSLSSSPGCRVRAR